MKKLWVLLDGIQIFRLLYGVLDVFQIFSSECRHPKKRPRSCTNDHRNLTSIWLTPNVSD
jgi:hypothetical protein